VLRLGLEFGVTLGSWSGTGGLKSPRVISGGDQMPEIGGKCPTFVFDGGDAIKRGRHAPKTQTKDCRQIKGTRPNILPGVGLRPLGTPPWYLAFVLFYMVTVNKIKRRHTPLEPRQGAHLFFSMH